MRRDVLEVMADELLERAAHPLASFTSMEDGRPRLAGMRAGRKWDVDREQDGQVREHDRKMQVEIRRLMKLRARRKKPEAYRIAGRRYEAANKERRRQLRLARYWKNRDRLLARLRASQERHRAKRRAESLAYYYAHRDQQLARMRAYYLTRPRKGTRRCSVCQQPGHNRVRCRREQAK